MAKLVMIIGPQAVGKMTVGQELEKITDLKFMHNHETLELPARLFGWGSEQRKRLTALFRMSIFEEMAKSDLRGLIYTQVMAFNLQSEWDWFYQIKDMFESYGGSIAVVELEADMNERLARNKTENRLKNKPSKRDTEFTEKEIIEDMDKYRLYSNDGEFDGINYVKINNTYLSAEDTAKIIKEKFNL